MMMKMKFHALVLYVSAAFAISQSCTLCPNGTESNRTVVIPFSNGGETTNCGHLEKHALKANDDAACQEIKSNAAWCCPNVKPKCTLCHGGIPPPDASLVVEKANRATCGELDYLASLSRHEGACQRVTTHAKACNCPASATTERSLVCSSICPDGSTLTMEQRDILVGRTSSGLITTCGDLEDIVAKGVQQERCSTYSHIGVLTCGCKATSLPKPACQLCDTGKVPANLLYDVDGKGSTCVEFMSALATVNDPESCRAFQATAGVYCQCVDPTALGSSCRICGGNTILPDPTRVANPEKDISCSEIEYVANLNGGEFCSRLQTNYKETCCQPVQEDIYDTDQLPYSDDTYIGATAPPFVRPAEESDLLKDSSAQAKDCGTVLVTMVGLLAVSVSLL